MCGIIAGVTHEDNITGPLLRQLKKLEYRGYDSAGVATICQNTGSLHVKHNTDSIESLTHDAETMPQATIGIAHTRWATHGQVSLNNAHPHIAEDRIALVHNGIIENHEALKESLSEENITWKSQTDSEVIAHLINFHLKKGLNITSAIEKTTRQLQGTYALAIIDKEKPQNIYIIAHESSLILARSDSATFVSSDQNAVTGEATHACTVPKDVIFNISATNIQSQQAHPELNWLPVQKTKNRDIEQTEKSITYQEIKEQESVLKGLIDTHISKEGNIEVDPKLSSLLKGAKRILMIACGSSYYCAQTGKYWLERIARMPVSVELASEFRYRSPVIEKDTILITLSQSGETLDTISAKRYLKEHHPEIKSISIGNNSLSTLAQESDYFWPTHAGPEIGVATTKVFTAQLFCLACLCGHLTANKKQVKTLTEPLLALPKWINEVYKSENQIKSIAEKLSPNSAILFCGRSDNYPIAQEAALKLKELAYVHAQAYAAGELKHGPLALIEPSLTTVFFVNQDIFLEKIKSNISEVLSRKGKVLLVGPAPVLATIKQSKNITKMVTTEQAPPEQIAAFTNVVCAQLLTYHIAKDKKCAIDKPRNLAKCVTVE